MAHPRMRLTRAHVCVLLTLALLASFAGVCSEASAHVLSASERSAPVLQWSFEPWVVMLLAVSLGLYLIGYMRVRSRSRLGRKTRARQLSAFGAGWLTLVIALDSPLDSLSAALFSAHMVQHEMLMIVAAPLLVLGRPLAVWLWAFPPSIRRMFAALVRARPFHNAWHVVSAPACAWLLHAAALWAWHMPRLFEAALASPGIHALQHASFLLSALLFWWSIFGETARHDQSGFAMLALFTTMVHTGALGALLTLAPGLWYPMYVEPTSALGMDPLQDQQLGGLVMWVPGGLSYLVAALATGAKWLLRRAPASVLREAYDPQRDGGS